MNLRTVAMYSYLPLIAAVTLSCGPVVDLSQDPAAAAEFNRGKQDLYSMVDQGEFSEALEPTYDLLDQQPEDVELLYVASLVVEQSGYLKHALLLSQQAYDLAPDDPVAQNNLAYSLAQLGIELDRAQELIDRALSSARANSQMLDTLAWVLYRRGQSAKALKVVRAALNYPMDKWQLEILKEHEQEIEKALLEH